MTTHPKSLADAYTALEVIDGASEDVVRFAFKAKALTAHPDKGGSEPAFKAIEAALAMIEAAGFPGRRSVDDATRERHVPSTPLVCPGCGRSNRIPAGRTKLRCGACGESLLAKGSASRDREREPKRAASTTTDPRPRFTCDLCQAWYFSPELVQVHRRRIHPSAPTTSRGSGRSSSSRRPTFRCELCGASYSSAGLVEDHRLRVHREASAPRRGKAATEDPRTKHHCSQCSAWYFTRALVDEHRRRMH